MGVLRPTQPGVVLELTLWEQLKEPHNTVREKNTFHERGIVDGTKSTYIYIFWVPQNF